MNRNLILGFLGGIVFVLSVIAGALTADAFRDHGDGELVIPTASDDIVDRVPLMTPDEVGVFFDAEGGDGADLPSGGPYSPTEVAGEFVALDDAVPLEEVGGGSADDPGGGPGGGGEDAGADDVPVTPEEGEPPAEEERGLPWEVEDLPFSIIDLLFEDFTFPFLRFLDYCADHPDDPACPPGTGGTVLMPVDDHLAVGEYRIRNTLYRTRQPFWTCEAPSGMRSNEYFLLISATHPSRMEIDYYPNDDPSDVTSTVVDLSNPSHRFFGDFVAHVTEHGSGPPTGVHHCFVFEGERRAQTYVIEARGTSFTGETDTEDFTFRTSERRNRPPVQIAPLSDYDATLVVPIKSEPHQSSVVRLLRPEEGLTCAEIEDATVVDRTRREVLISERGTPFNGYHSRERIGDDIINAPDWRYDPAYDTYAFWDLSLEEGNSYRVCIWWVESLDRSYDPLHTGIVERETRYITTPDRLRASIAVVAIEAPSSRDVEPHSFRLTGRSHCRHIDWPNNRIEAGSIRTYGGGSHLCAYLGYRQPALTELTAVLSDGTTKDFVIATPNTGEPRVERVLLDLSQERASGLCGSSFGDCDPPTSTVPGPIVHLDVVFTEGDSRGRGEWNRGEPFRFDPPEREPEELPEQPRMDFYSSGVEGERRDALRVTANFDRPVTLQAFFEGDLTEQCFRDGATADDERSTAFSSTDFLISYSFVLDGLCTYTPYAVRLEVADEAGGSIVYANTPREPGEYVWNGWDYTLGYDVTYQVNYRTGLGGNWETYGFGATVGGRATTVGGDDRCLITRTTPFQSQTWGEKIDVRIGISIAQANRVDGRCRAVRGAAFYEADIETSFLIEDFLAGPIEIPVSLEPVYGSTPIGGTPIVVVIQGSEL